MLVAANETQTSFADNYKTKQNKIYLESVNKIHHTALNIPKKENTYYIRNLQPIDIQEYISGQSKLYQIKKYNY